MKILLSRLAICLLLSNDKFLLGQTPSGRQNDAHATGGEPRKYELIYRNLQRNEKQNDAVSTMLSKEMLKR